MNSILSIERLSIARDEREIIHDLSLTIEPGSLHVLMGPNGSGKTSLVNAIAGVPGYAISTGHVKLGDNDLLDLSPDARARAGLFLSPQHPPEIPGVTYSNFLKAALTARNGKPVEIRKFHQLLRDRMDDLAIDHHMATRHVNVGFSGGEKKRAEMLQLLVLEPSFALLDETDAGVDPDATKLILKAVSLARQKGTGILFITHSARFVEQLDPTMVHVMKHGNIVATGGVALAQQIAEHGFDHVS